MDIDEEFCFGKLKIINMGTCRYCDFLVGIPTTVQHIQQLQLHYKTHHPVSYYNPGLIPSTNTVLQQVKPGEHKVIGVFDYKKCIQHDCYALRKEAGEVKPKIKNGPHGIVANPQLRILQIEAHAPTWAADVTKEQIFENDLFLCVSHNCGNTQKMHELFFCVWHYVRFYRSKFPHGKNCA